MSPVVSTRQQKITESLWALEAYALARKRGGILPRVQTTPARRGATCRHFILR